MHLWAYFFEKPKGDESKGRKNVISVLISLQKEMYRVKMCIKKGKRKVQGVPQSQTAALPRPQEEEF